MSAMPFRSLPLTSMWISCHGMVGQVLLVMKVRNDWVRSGRRMSQGSRG